MAPIYAMDHQTLVLISNELLKARRLFPDLDVGKLLLTIEDKLADLNNDYPASRVLYLSTCAHIAVMAIRLMEEHDGTRPIHARK